MQSIPHSDEADVAGMTHASEGHHGLGTSLLVPQNPQGEEDSKPARNCSGFDDAQDPQTAVPSPLLPMASCSSQVCLFSEGKGSCPLKLDPAPLLTLNKITCILAV